MVVFYDSIPENIMDWIPKQHIFWVATAPVGPTGHVNCSPKGAYDCFHLVHENKVWYEDLTGSGNETISHIRENGRITVMFIAFDGPPRIVRLWGTGSVHEYGTPEYDALIPSETRKPGSRAAIVVDIHKVGSSCGYTIPYYDFRGNRTLLLENMARRETADGEYENPNPSIDIKDNRSEKGLRNYWVSKNMTSIDGLPGLKLAPYVKKTPKNSWTLESEKLRVKPGTSTRANATSSNTATVNGMKISAVTSLSNSDARVVVAFSLGVLLTSLFVKFTGISQH